MAQNASAPGIERMQPETLSRSVQALRASGVCGLLEASSASMVCRAQATSSAVTASVTAVISSRSFRQLHRVGDSPPPCRW